MRPALCLFTAATLFSARAIATESLPVDHIRAVELRGGGSVTVVPGPVERATILEGSSRFTAVAVTPEGKLVVKTCASQCPSNYRLRLEVQAPRVPDLAIDGGGMVVTASGFGAQDNLNVAVNGGGRIDARSVAAMTIAASVKGGGELLVRPARALSAAVSGGGHVRYWGNPTTTVAIHGGGSVSRGD